MSRLGPSIPPDHAQHDTLLVAQLAGGDPLDAAERGRAQALVAGCGPCAALAADLQAVSRAVATEAVPPRRRDFRLTPEQAEQARGGPWLRFVRRLALPETRSLRPVAAGLMSLGLLMVVAGSFWPQDVAEVAMPASAPAVLEATIGPSEAGSSFTDDLGALEAGSDAGSTFRETEPLAQEGNAPGVSEGDGTSGQGRLEAAAPDEAANLHQGVDDATGLRQELDEMGDLERDQAADAPDALEQPESDVARAELREESAQEPEPPGTVSKAAQGRDDLDAAADQLAAERSSGDAVGDPERRADAVSATIEPALEGYAAPETPELASDTAAGPRADDGRDQGAMVPAPAEEAQPPTDDTAAQADPSVTTHVLGAVGAELENEVAPAVPSQDGIDMATVLLVIGAVTLVAGGILFVIAWLGRRERSDRAIR